MIARHHSKVHPNPGKVRRGRGGGIRRHASRKHSSGGRNIKLFSILLSLASAMSSLSACTILQLADRHRRAESLALWTIIKFERIKLEMALLVD